MVRKKLGGDLRTKCSLTRIGKFITPCTWVFPEAPVDRRALGALKEWNSKIGYRIENKYQRKHGGLEGLRQSLNLFDRHYKNFSARSVDDQEMWLRSIKHTKQLFHSASKATVNSPKRYRPPHSNSGFPYFSDRVDINEQTIADAVSFITHFNSTPGKKFKDYIVPPVIPAMKSSTGKISSGPKTRGIWCYPAMMTCIESMFGVPLYKLLLQKKNQRGFPLMHGKGAFTDARGFIKSIDVGQSLCVKDWKKGDSQMPPWLIKAAKDVLASNINFDTYEFSAIDSTWSTKNRRLWDFVWWYFQNTPIVFNDVLYRKKGGIPSGSLFTLLCWCAVSAVTSVFLSLKLENRLLSSNDLRVCGDDAAVRVHNQELTIDLFINCGKEQGIHFHGEPKSSLLAWPNHIHAPVLSTVFAVPGKIERDYDDLFCRMVYPSRWISNREESVARVAMVSMSVLNTMADHLAFSNWYIAYKPAWLKRPIFIDRNLMKYYKYVIGRSFVSFSTLGDVLRAYKNTLAHSLLYIRV